MFFDSKTLPDSSGSGSCSVRTFVTEYNVQHYPKHLEHPKLFLDYIVICSIHSANAPYIHGLSQAFLSSC